LHRAAKPEFINIFITSWEQYLRTIRVQEKTFGVELDAKTTETMPPEQKQKLNELKEETRKAFSKK
jgi:hypothetical protein